MVELKDVGELMRFLRGELAPKNEDEPLDEIFYEGYKNYLLEVLTQIRTKLEDLRSSVSDGFEYCSDDCEIASLVENRVQEILGECDGIRIR